MKIRAYNAPRRARDYELDLYHKKAPRGFLGAICDVLRGSPN